MSCFWIAVGLAALVVIVVVYLQLSTAAQIVKTGDLAARKLSERLRGERDTDEVDAEGGEKGATAAEAKATREAAEAPKAPSASEPTTDKRPQA